MQELQKSKKKGLVVTVELPSFPHAVLYNQTIVGPRHAGAIEDPSSPSASLLPLYDPEVSVVRYVQHCRHAAYTGVHNNYVCRVTLLPGFAAVDLANCCEQHLQVASPNTT